MQAIKVLNMIKVYGKPIRVNKASQDKRSQDIGANLFIGNLDPEVDEKVIRRKPVQLSAPGTYDLSTRLSYVRQILTLSGVWSAVAIRHLQRFWRHLTNAEDYARPRHGRIQRLWVR